MTDLARLLAAIDDLELRVDLYALRRLPTVLRQARLQGHGRHRRQRAHRRRAGGHDRERRYAIAFDLGTTTVVATLLDMSTGTPGRGRSMLNKQQPFGADVITRISATMLDPDALGRLATLAHETLDELAHEVCERRRGRPAQVYEIAVAGNATMTRSPWASTRSRSGSRRSSCRRRRFPELLAVDLGVHVHPRARAVVLPALGAYVGGDIVAGMLASGMDRDKRMRLFIDVGTNCEIVLGNGERIVATAAPAGPAFEGGAIRCGMRAADGAIEVVKISDDGVELPGDRRRASRRGCAGRGWSTRSPSSSGSACWTRPGASSPRGRAARARPEPR